MNIVLRLAQIECALSPENLTCDGECPREEWLPRYHALTREQKELRKQLGRSPSYDEMNVALNEELERDRNAKWEQFQKQRMEKLRRENAGY